MKCNSCFDGRLRWKRKTENVFGWTMRIYRCNSCGLEESRVEMPGKEISVFELNHINK